MEGKAQRSVDGSPTFDTLDIDLVVKVLAYSPFFVFFIPVFSVLQGAQYTDSVVVYSGIYYVVISVFWFFKWYSRLYRKISGPGRFDWGKQIVVVTGGASGVGELLADTLAVRDVKVVILDIKPIMTKKSNITYYKCDVSKWEEVEAVAKEIVKEIGHPTVLINNAGIVQGKLLLDLTPGDIHQTFGVNTLAHLWTLKAFLPNMVKEKAGHIVSVASVMGLGGSAQLMDYCASKAAVISMNESLHYELKNRYMCPQIHTTLVIPGHISTHMFSSVAWPPHPSLKFFFPSAEPVTIVKRIIAALDEQHSQTILLPFYAHLMQYLFILPSALRDFVQWLTAADFYMEGFVKTTTQRPPTLDVQSSSRTS